MKIKCIAIRNFRRLESVQIDLEEDTTVFVGPNNSGKTSATAIFRYFLKEKKFSIYDFSVKKLENINLFGNEGKQEILPSIELDIWFSIDPSNISFGRAFSLLPKLSEDFYTVGIRLKYEVLDPEKMRSDYISAYPVDDDGKRSRILSQFLNTDQNLNKYFEITYHSLDSTGEEVVEKSIKSKEGRSLVHELVRVDFIDAQRNIDDEEENRSNRLSTAFAAFYKKNLDQAEAAESAYQVIDENNQKLTEHYEEHFSSLINVIQNFGVPSINDRVLKIVSSLSPENALRGNTELYYIDTGREHELPEMYNGLGFKNLIYMAIQIIHFHLQWLRTEKNRPLCQLIFIEEPEVHLHAQVQQTFITNIWNIISMSAKDSGEEELVPQILITTHSSHILYEVEFAKARYFQRCELDGEDRNTIKTLNASKVLSLREFIPDPIQVDGEEIDTEESLKFLKKYMKLTHCDLFFADAVILVEGIVEKLLLPKMVEKTSPTLSSNFLTILEVGGAYAHRFSSLFKFLYIPYLVITDLDSVEPSGRHPVCRGDIPDALTSNASLKYFFDVSTVSDLLALNSAQKVNSEQDRCVVFQTSINVIDGTRQLQMVPRTIEEAFAFDNFKLLRSDQIDLGISIPDNLAEAYENIHSHIKSSNFKKTEFALDILSSGDRWMTPTYIAEGLEWLEKRLASGSATSTHVEN